MQKLFLSVFIYLATILTLLSLPGLGNKPDKAKSLQAFDEMLKVIRHPRCMNCHPSDDYPRQGDNSTKHLFNVQRGKDDKGLATMRCYTCHQTENNRYSNVPGAPHWQLAPKSMGWQGLSKTEIGKSLLDKTQNGNRDIEKLVEHLTKDNLVQWAWQPGKGRQLPPLSQKQFHEAVKTWAENGAFIPQ
jgi:hypothetical protein